MNNAELENNVTSLRNKAVSSRNWFGFWVGATVINGSGLMFDVINNNPNTFATVTSAFGIIACASLAGNKGLEAIQNGQEVAALAAVLAQREIPADSDI